MRAVEKGEAYAPTQYSAFALIFTKWIKDHEYVQNNDQQLTEINGGKPFFWLMSEKYSNENFGVLVDQDVEDRNTKLIEQGKPKMTFDETQNFRSACAIKREQSQKGTAFPGTFDYGPLDSLHLWKANEYHGFDKFSWHVLNNQCIEVMVMRDLIMQYLSETMLSQYDLWRKENCIKNKTKIKKNAKVLSFGGNGNHLRGLQSKKSNFYRAVISSYLKDDEYNIDSPPPPAHDEKYYGMDDAYDVFNVDVNLDFYQQDIDLCIDDFDGKDYDLLVMVTWYFVAPLISQLCALFQLTEYKN
eukprot:418329_1